MGVSTFSTGILVWKQSLRKCELYEADWHFKHRQSYCLSQTALPLYVCSGLCFLFQQNVCIIKKNPRNFCGSPCWIGTYFTNVAFEKWSLDFLWFMKNLLREYTIFFWFHRKTFTQIIEKTYPVSKNHFIAVGEGWGGYFHIDRQVEKCSCIPLRFHVHLCLSSPPYKFALVRLSFADPLVMLKSYALKSTWKAAQ